MHSIIAERLATESEKAVHSGSGVGRGIMFYRFTDTANVYLDQGCVYGVCTYKVLISTIRNINILFYCASHRVKIK